MSDTDKVAFALRKEWQGTVIQRETDDDLGTEVPLYGGALLAAGEDAKGKTRDLNVAELLEEGDGVIVVDLTDSAAVLALDEHPPLKRVHVGAGDNAEPDNVYEARPVKALREDAKNRGITGHSADGIGHPELVAALTEHDLRLAEDTLAELSPLTVPGLAQAHAGRELEADANPDPDDAGDGDTTGDAGEEV